MIVYEDRIAETPRELQFIDDELCGTCDAEAVVWSGRAATSLFLAYRAATRFGDEIDSPEVIVPSISCATPANTAILAGCVPRFADIDPKTGLLTLESIKARWTERTRAIVFVHLFGQTADLDEIARWCHDRGALLIEDMAQSLGAVLPNGQPAGSVGDMAVFSFNPTKILECGGGALVLKSMLQLECVKPELKELVSRFNRVTPDLASQLGMSYRNLHHSLVALLRLRPEGRVNDLFMGMRSQYDCLLLRPMSSFEQLVVEWKGITNKLDARLANAEQYFTEFKGGPFQLLDQWQTSGVCWRFSLLVDFPDSVVPFCDAVRRDQFHVSNLYWELPSFFNPSDRSPNAEQFCRRIVNLWVDAGTSHETVQRCARSLLRHAENYPSAANRGTPS